MLILNRKVGESIILGDNIEVKILDIQDGKIKIGIEAPKDISILRKEVYDAVMNLIYQFCLKNRVALVSNPF